MGRVALKWADCVFLTSDNPRNEEPMAIIEDVLSGIQPSASGLFIQENRETAIRMAVSEAREGDVLLIAGKGHECYQIMGDKKIPYNDRDEIKKALGVKELRL